MGRDRSPRPVVPLRTVRCPQTAEVVLLHHTGEATPLVVADDVDMRHLGEVLDRQLVSDRRSGLSALQPKLADEPRGLAASPGLFDDLRVRPLLGPLATQLGDSPALRTVGQPTGLLAVAQLHRLVPVAVGRLDLQHHTRSRLDHGHRGHRPIGVVHLRHADFAAQQSDWHHITQS